MRRALIISAILLLSACENDSSININNYITRQEFNAKVDDLELEISTLQQFNMKLEEDISRLEYQLSLSEKKIEPYNFNDKIVFSNLRMPLIILAPNDNSISLSARATDSAIYFYYLHDDFEHLVVSYAAVPRILVVKEPKSQDEYYENNLIKYLDENWAIVKIDPIATELDSGTLSIINEYVKKFEFY